jgi:hypothetical protein
MALSEIFFLVIVLYLLYRFFANFLIPVVRTTRQVREQFRNMQNPGNNNNPGGSFQNNNSGGSFQNNNSGGSFQNNNGGGSFQRSYNSATQAEEQPKKKEPRTPSSNTMGEYIDFEEVK